MADIEMNVPTKFCKHCGAKIPIDAVICTSCGRQVEELRNSNNTPNIVINNDNTNTNVNAVGVGMRPKKKIIALLLCFFLGFIGAHKFYEEKTGTGILYIFTVGLFGIGWFIDFITLIFKPSIYYV